MKSVINSNDTIAAELLRWILENVVPPPWIKEIDTIVLRDTNGHSKNIQ